MHGSPGSTSVSSLLSFPFSDCQLTALEATYHWVVPSPDSTEQVAQGRLPVSHLENTGGALSL